jgi:hypothetical protein
MAKRKAKRVTLDALADNPALLRTLAKGEKARLVRQFRRLFDILMRREFSRLERTRQLVEKWILGNSSIRAEKTPRRRLRALAGGKAKA